MAARALRLFIEGGPRAAAGDGSSLSILSSREIEVLAQLTDGLTDREISDALVISPRTVESHVSNIPEARGAKSSRGGPCLSRGRRGRGLKRAKCRGEADVLGGRLKRNQQPPLR